jgi:predicted nucleotidyltransferase
MSTFLESRQEVIERIRGLAPPLRAVSVKRLALFGSFVRDAQHSASDVDLLVEFAPGRKTFDDFTAACDLLEASLGRQVELVTIESLSPYVGPHILREAEDVVVSA